MAELNGIGQAALDYKRRGWAPIPVRPGEKTPRLPNWPALRLTEAEMPTFFSDTGNVGVILGEASNGLVDVDLDSPEALALAPKFLAATGAVFGRRSRPGSHLLYTAYPTPATEKFQDPAGAVVVELRSTNTQTIFPPSVADGERREWTRDGEPAKISGPLLRASVAQLAAASLFACHWPAEGSRQETALALAGGLLRLDWNAETVARFIAAVAQGAGDEETPKRAKAGEFTARRMNAGQRATGWPHLAQLLGADIVERARKWLDENGHPTTRRITTGKAIAGRSPKETKDVSRNPESLEDGCPLGDLPAQIVLIRCDGERLAFEKKRDIAQAVLGDFLGGGRFYRTREARSFYFENSSHRLFFLESDDFTRLLAERSRLNPTEIEFKYVIEHLLTYTRRQGIQVQVYEFGHFDGARRMLYVSDLSGRIFVLSEAGMHVQPNGTDGVLFQAFPKAEPIEYVAAEKRTGSLQTFFDEIPFDAAGPLSRDAYCSLLRVFLLSIFFPELHKTKVLPLFVGPQGSRKTSTARKLGILLVGADCQVSNLEAGDRGEQAFIASICGRPFSALDNADARISWLPDQLARYATGQEIGLRQLYTTNELASFRPISTLILTARDPQFRRPDVAERLLIFPLKRMPGFIGESVIVDQMAQGRASIFSELLDDLKRILPAVLDSKVSVTTHRMADFASFGARVMALEGREVEFDQWLRDLWKGQAGFATEDEPLVELLAMWVKEHKNSEIETGPLFNELQRLAEQNRQPMLKTASALGKRLRELETVLEEALSLKVSHIRIGNTTRWRFGEVIESDPLLNSSDSPQSPIMAERKVAEMSDASDFAKPLSGKESPAAAKLDGRGLPSTTTASARAPRDNGAPPRGRHPCPACGALCRSEAAAFFHARVFCQRGGAWAEVSK